VADLFAGAGGLSEGFRLAGFESAIAVELDKWAASTYEANFGPHVICAPIEFVDVERASGRFVWRHPDGAAATGKIDVLVGGPPCQGFSPLGRMHDWDVRDPRNKLWRHYVRILSAVQPAVFVIENVPELLKSAEFQTLTRAVIGLGYELDFGVLNAADFGVPQSRKRAIVIGSHSRVQLPRGNSSVRSTVRDAIGDLSEDPDGNNWHVGRNPTARSMMRYKTIPPGGNRFDLMRKRPDLTPRCWLEKLTGSTDVFGRMLWDAPSPTIRTEFFKPEKGRYLHPSANRPITIREAARLQTFPDGFQFIGSNVQVAKQIGNAVPIELARRIAETVAIHLGQAS
jgi:DNA (cytosine-5)-methyltransferase 1